MFNISAEENLKNRVNTNMNKEEYYLFKNIIADGNEKQDEESSATVFRTPLPNDIWKIYFHIIEKAIK